MWLSTVSPVGFTIAKVGSCVFSRSRPYLVSYKLCTPKCTWRTQSSCLKRWGTAAADWDAYFILLYIDCIGQLFCRVRSNFTREDGTAKTRALVEKFSVKEERVILGCCNNLTCFQVNCKILMLKRLKEKRVDFIRCSNTMLWWYLLKRAELRLSPQLLELFTA